MIALVAAGVLALVTQDRTPLVGAPREGAPRVATLWQGEVLEVRRESQGYAEIWDPTHERGGWVRLTRVRAYPVAPESTADLQAIVRFLRDTPGSEALGIAHAALALRTQEPGAIDGELFEAIGVMGDRLAARASSRSADEVVAAHLEVARSYGVTTRAIPRPDGGTRLCADGGAWQRALALARAPSAKLRAVLALTAPECLDTTSEAARRTEDAARAALVEGVDAALLPPEEAERWRVRRARVWAMVAFDRARGGDRAGSAEAAERAVTALAGVDPARLADDDRGALADAAVQVGAVRWAAQAAVPAEGPLAVRARAGESAGETCLTLSRGARVVLERCTFAEPWLASQSAAPDGHALALAVSPLPGWRELWLFREVDGAWGVDVLPPASGAPELGYVEHAGWSPDGDKLLVVREAREDRQPLRRFEVLRVDSLTVESEGARPGPAFARWRSAEWRAGTVALR